MPKGGNKLTGEDQPLLAGRQDTTATMGSTAPSDLEDDNGIPALPAEPTLGKTKINPRDIPSAFVKKVGSKSYDWSLVSSISAVPFSNNGLSEAKMYHGIIDCHRPTPKPSTLSEHGLDSHSPGSPTSSGRGSNMGTRASVSKMLRRTFSSSALSSDGRGISKPPPVCVIKHYDTNTVDSTSMIIRAARHITEMTCESMARHEIFFYTKVAPILAHDRQILERQYQDAVRDDPEMELLSRGLRGRFPLRPQNCFNTAELFFANHKDRGEPGLLRYVCCGSGTGSTTTIGMADLANSGFSFTHSEDDGLYDAASIRAALAAMANLHSSMWGRFDLKKKEDKSIRSESPVATPKMGPAPPPPRSGEILDFPDFTPAATQEYYQNDSIVSSGTRPPLVPTAGGGGAQETPPTATFLLGQASASVNTAPVHPSSAIIKNPPYAIIPRAIHRFGKSAIERTNNNNDLTQCVPSLVELFRKWQHYWPVLGVPEVQRALRKVHKNWHSIRSKTARIINKPQTILHGDFHYRNIGFRRINQHSQRKEHRNFVLNSSDEARLAAEHRELALRERSEVYEAGPRAPDLAAGNSPPPTEMLGEGRHSSPPPPSSTLNAPPALEVCAVDFQGSGTGHIAVELVYFICCSLPVDMFVESSLGTKEMTRLSGGGPGGPEDMQFSLSAGAKSARSGSNSSKERVSGQAERAKKEHQFTLTECRELDNAIIREYYDHLSQDVRTRYSLSNLVEDLHVLVKHWSGCLLMDMASSNVNERGRLKQSPGLGELVEWGEKTANRILWTLTSILTNPKGRVSTGSSVDSCIGAGGSFDSSASSTSAPRRGTSPKSSQVAPPLVVVDDRNLLLGSSSKR